MARARHVPHLERRRGRIVYVDARGRSCDYQAVLGRRRLNATADEIRSDHTLRALWWRLNRRSSDVPDSRAARADISDGGKGAAEIVRRAEGGNFYRRRLRLAAAYLAGHMRKTPEEVGAFLLAVFRNGTRHRRATLAETGLTRDGYYKLVRRCTRLLEAGTG